MFNKKTVKDIDLKGKRVLLRADYNVPVKDGMIDDDYRIKQSLPTIQYIWEQYQSSLVIISHLGRPDGKPDSAFSLEPVAKRLSELLGKPVKFAKDCIGEEAKKMADELKPGEILLLENVRFHPGEEADDVEFAKQIVEASGAEVFVQDGFGVVHRAHATTDAICKLLPAVAGLLLENEVATITKVMEKPEHPLVAVIGGAKISDKIDFLKRLIELADAVAVGGAMANNFLLAEGIGVGKSLVEPEVMETTQAVLDLARKAAQTRPFSFLVPVDAVVSTALDGTMPTRIVDLSSHSLADIEAYPKLPKPAAYTVAADEKIVDIGPLSAMQIAGTIRFAKTVIWNGPCGVAEVKGIAGADKPFAHGTRLVVEAMIGSGKNDKSRPFSLVGGGDTAAYVESEDLIAEFDHVSTGGGASLDLMSGHKLPGVEALLAK